MFKFIGKIFSLVFYWVLMIFGSLLFVSFLIVGIWVGLHSQEVADAVMQFLSSVFTEMSDTAPAYLKYIIAIPFWIVSLIGLAIVILTQRTANINRRLNSTNRKTKKAVKELKEEK